MESTKDCERRAALGSEKEAALLGACVVPTFQFRWILDPLRPVIEPREMLFKGEHATAADIHKPPLLTGPG